MGNNVLTKHITLSLSGSWQRLASELPDYRPYFAGIEIKTSDLSSFKLKNGNSGSEYTVNANGIYRLADREPYSAFKNQDLYVLGTAGKILEVELWLYDFQA